MHKVLINTCLQWSRLKYEHTHGHTHAHAHANAYTHTHSMNKETEFTTTTSLSTQGETLFRHFIIVLCFTKLLLYSPV